MKPILGRIMMADQNLPTMTKEDKDYAQFQKEQWYAKQERDKIQFHRKQQDYRQISLHNLQGNMASQIDSFGKKVLMAKDQEGNQKIVVPDYNTISKQNPITGEVIFYQNGEKLKVDYQNRKEIAHRHVEPNGGFRAIHAANKETLDKGQKLKRNKEAEDFLWRTAKQEDDHRPTLQVREINFWNMKSGEKDLFEVRQKDKERHEKIYGESTLERKFVDKKAKGVFSGKLLNQSLDYKDLDLAHLNKIKPAFYESYDTPLNGPGNRSELVPKPFPVMDAKYKNEDIKALQFERSQQVEPLFKSLGRGLEHLHQYSQDEVPLVQNKQRVEQRPTYDSLDKHIQSLKRTEEMERFFKPTPEIEIKLKKRIPTPGGHGEERQQQLLPRRASKKLEIYD